MANMSYCRFQNTATDLADCVSNWDEDPDQRELSPEEKRAKARIVQMAREIVDAEDNV